MALCALGIAVTGCAEAPPAVAPASGPAVEVRRAGSAYSYADGAAARRQADAQCGGRVRTTIYDRFDDATGAWVYPGGCA